MLNNNDLLWTVFLRCLAELEVFSSDQTQRLVASKDKDVLMISSELTLPIRKLLGALFSGLSFILETSHLAVNVVLLSALNRVLFPSLGGDRDAETSAFFNLAANSCAIFFYYEPFAMRLGMAVPHSPALHWRFIEKNVQELVYKQSDDPSTSPTGAISPMGAPTIPPPIRLKGVREEDLRVHFDKCLCATLDHSGNACADLATLERTCRWSVNAYPLAERLGELRSTVSFPDYITWSEFLSLVDFSPPATAVTAAPVSASPISSPHQQQLVAPSGSLSPNLSLHNVPSSSELQQPPTEDSDIEVMDSNELAHMHSRAPQSSLARPVVPIKLSGSLHRERLLDLDDEFDVEELPLSPEPQRISSSIPPSLNSSYAASLSQTLPRRPVVREQPSATARSHESLLRSGLIVDLRGRHNKSKKPYTARRVYKSYDFDTEDADDIEELPDDSVDTSAVLEQTLTQLEAPEPPLEVLVETPPAIEPVKESMLSVPVPVAPASRRSSTFSMTELEDDEEPAPAEDTLTIEPEDVLEIPAAPTSSVVEPAPPSMQSESVPEPATEHVLEPDAQLEPSSAFASVVLELSPPPLASAPVSVQSVSVQSVPVVIERPPPPPSPAKESIEVQCDLGDEPLERAPVSTLSPSAPPIRQEASCQMEVPPLPETPPPVKPRASMQSQSVVREQARVHDVSLAEAIRRARQARARSEAKVAGWSSPLRPSVQSSEDSSVLRLNKKFLDQWTQELGHHGQQPRPRDVVVNTQTDESSLWRSLYT